MLKNVCLLFFSLLLVNCVSSNRIERQPDAEPASAPILLPLPIFLGDSTPAQIEDWSTKKPWLFFESSRYCDKKPSDLNKIVGNLYPASGSAESVKEWHDTLLQSHAKAYGQIACDKKFEELSFDLFKIENKPRFEPLVNQRSKITGYLVGSYRSMLHQNQSLAIIKSADETPVYESTDVIFAKRRSLQISEISENKPGTNFLPDLNYEDREFLVSTQPHGDYGCQYSVYKKPANKLIESFPANCLNADKVGRLIDIAGQKHVAYINYNFQEQEAAFSLKLRPIQEKTEDEIKKNWESRSTDRTVLYFPVPSDLTHNVDVIYTPLDLFLQLLPDSTYRLMVNLLTENSHRIVIYQLDQNFSNPRILHESAMIPGQVIKFVSASSDALMYSVTPPLSKPHFYTLVLQTNKKKSLEGDFSPEPMDRPVITETFLYPTKDGKKLPIMISHDQNFRPFSNKNFGILRSYGGFNSANDYLGKDRFLDQVVYARGGITATAVIRGGGDLGPKSWQSALGKNRIKSFEDLISASEFLIRRGFAFQRRLALHGESNGGLTVLATAQLRPELFGAVVAVSPVTNVLAASLYNSHAAAWSATDYGDPKDPEVIDFWKNHAPAMNLQKVDPLPPLLLRTAHDDANVNPVHTLQLYMGLQKHKSFDKVYMIYLPRGYGHQPLSAKSAIEEFSYYYSFIFRALKIW